MRLTADDRLRRDIITELMCNLELRYDEFEAAYGRILEMATPRARLVYWNMMAPRRAPGIYASAVRRDRRTEMRLKGVDKAFFYADLVIEDAP